MPELCFAGRSNVGKSSLINALTGRNALARVSVTPGRTRQINFFDLGGRLMLTDLPGYGYAKASKEQVANWTRLIELYLVGRAPLRRVLLLIDARHGPKDVDRAVMAMLDKAAVAYQAVLTKTDQLRPAELAERIDGTARELSRHAAAHPDVLPTSAEKGHGIAELRGALATLAERAGRAIQHRSGLKHRHRFDGWPYADPWVSIASGDFHRSRTSIFASALLSLDVAVGGWFVGRGFVEARAGDRFVTVKGVAEQSMKADLALWPMRFVTTSNRLTEAQEQIAADTQKVLAFLIANGLPGEAVEVESLQVTDLLAQAYRAGPIESRFIVAQTLMVRTADVDKVSLASQKLGDLVAAGIVLGSEGPPPSGPMYLFTRLNDVKPAMIAAATKSAREGADSSPTIPAVG